MDFKSANLVEMKENNIQHWTGESWLSLILDSCAVFLCRLLNYMILVDWTDLLFLKECYPWISQLSPQITVKICRCHCNDPYAAYNDQALWIPQKNIITHSTKHCELVLQDSTISVMSLSMKLFYPWALGVFLTVICLICNNISRSDLWYTSVLCKKRKEELCLQKEI